MSSGPDFAALFSAQMPVRRLEFTVEGQPGWVELRALNQSKFTQFQSMGARVVKGADGQIRHEADLDLTKRMMFLVAHTVSNYDLPLKGTALNSEGEAIWSRLTPPERKERHVSEIETRFEDCSPGFWVWLVEECLRENGLGEEQEKNSSGSSAS